jgi:transposase-like protein
MLLMMTDKQRPVVAPTEVRPKAKRRTFSAEFKRRVLAEADACTEPGAIGALLRREGLYSSHLTEWRAVRKRGELEALAPKKRGPEAAPAPDARDREVDELKRQLAKATIRAERAEALIDIQKKVAALLVTPLEDPRGK